jgi:three-Cys-motif partner protein
MALRESQINMYEHSEAKVRLLKLYLERYLNILSQSKYVGDIHVFDLFCGKGAYDEGGKGSPIIILETIKNIYFSNKAKGYVSGKFNCHFNDIDVDKINKLKSIILDKKLHYPDIGTIDISSEDYRKLIPQIVEKIDAFGKQKAFIFIDPYGYKDIRLSDIMSLLSSKKSEVLLFLPTQFMFRFEKKGTPESLKEFINELLPIDQWPKSPTGIDFIENLKDAFRNKLGYTYFVDSFIISRDLNQFFCLFFFTSHIYGFDRMLDAKWEIDEEEGYGWQYGRNSDLFATVEKQPNTMKFEQALKGFLMEFRSNSELYLFTLHNGHLPAHTNQILIQWQNENKIETIKPDGMPARKSSFYLNYQDYRDYPLKIKIKLK